MISVHHGRENMSVPRLPVEILHLILRSIHVYTLHSILLASKYLRSIAYACVEEIYKEPISAIGHTRESYVAPPDMDSISYRVLQPFIRLHTIIGICTAIRSERMAVAAAHSFIRIGCFKACNVKWLHTILSTRMGGAHGRDCSGLVLIYLKTNTQYVTYPEFIVCRPVVETSMHGPAESNRQYCGYASGTTIVQEGDDRFNICYGYNLVHLEPPLLSWIGANCTQYSRLLALTISITTEDILCKILTAIIAEYQRNNVPWPNILGPPPPVGYMHGIYASTQSISNPHIKGAVEYLLDSMVYIRDPEFYITLITDRHLQRMIDHDTIYLLVHGVQVVSQAGSI